MSVSEDGRATLRAFDQFIVKLSSRCNLSCDYCYVYELRDSGWRTRPRIMPARVRERLVSRIAEHVWGHRPERVRVLLHGGEPLLAGARVITEFTTAVRRAVREAGAEADFAVQTNGVLLTEELLDLLLGLDVRVGVSLDGYAEAHDRHRHGPGTRSDRGSHARVSAALGLLGGARYRPLFGGLLCTIDPANDPVRTFDALAAHRPPAADFLLPHGTWDHPPPGTGDGATQYGSWLRAVHDRWRETGRPMRIRLFESVDSLCRYDDGSSSEVLGTLPAAAVAIETDGTLTWTESLNAVAEGAGATGGTIFSHTFDGVLGLGCAPEYGVGSLCRECQECPLVHVCGGGLRAHRFGRGRGFDNPSVYCGDISSLIRHVEVWTDHRP
ncbi:FxsB family cyclophane-forming radical SAM/SPASM peptide maturase [Streptomyces sp. NPDC091209]|uniref:FxsB family cyclophane-forming radical SAM/SPASM peptide maturase n=1 Tax=Streptomyces sp. NPDC091209 TaxID=3365974 RepID=UPI0037FA6FBC